MLAAETVRAFLRANYTVSGAIEARPIGAGEENENFYVSAGGAAWVLRVYSPSHSTTGPRQGDEIDFELAFQSWARTCGVPTAPVIPNRRGEPRSSMTVEGVERFAVLFSFVPGSEASAYTSAVAQSVAGALAGLRKAGERFRYSRVRPWPGDLAAVSLSYYREHPPKSSPHAPIFERLFAWTEPAYARLQAAALPRGIVHGDVKLGNVLFADGSLQAVLDFDDYRESCLLDEPARTLMHDLDSPTRNPIRAGCGPLMQEIYAREGAVSPQEMAHLPTLLRARFLYDVSVYLENGLDRLVDDLLADAALHPLIFPDSHPTE